MAWAMTWMRCSPRTGAMPEHHAFEALQAENERLVALLESHGIEWRTPSFPDARPDSVEPAAEELPDLQRSGLSTADKVALFRRLFRGRTDVYPVRWESRTSGKSGYAPACANEWRAGVCEKPRIKCADCSGTLQTWWSDNTAQPFEPCSNPASAFFFVREQDAKVSENSGNKPGNKIVQV